MYNLKDIEKTYKGFSDSQIEKIAREESKSLRKEVLYILKNEIDKRNLDKTLINWIETETKFYEGLERKELLERIQRLECPKCKQESGKLLGFEINQIIGILIFTARSKKEKVLCRNCGKKEKTYALITTFFLGWWSIHGIIQTPILLIKEAFNFPTSDKISDSILNNFIDKNTGDLRRNGTGSVILTELIRLKNENEFLEDDI